jgi:hypothetical protein
MQMPEYGDISSGNVVGINSENWCNLANNPWATFTLAHELVHPFVMRGPPKADPFYALVIEGFPSYFYLPVLAEVQGEEFYSGLLERYYEAGYLKKRRDGTDLRDRPVPAEKPILEITAEEIGTYKDAFVLSDRVILMCNYIRARLGKERFFDFTRDLFGRESIDRGVFERVVLEYLPDAKDDLRVWLETTEYPDRLHLKNLERVGG